MATTPQRRLRTGTAAKRAQSIPDDEPAARRTIARQPKGHVSVSMGKKDDSLHEETREVRGSHRTFSAEDPPALVRVSGGLTKNMGNYESLRIDVSIEIPCHRDDVDETYNEASEFVANKIAEEETIWLGAPSKKTRG